MCLSKKQYYTNSVCEEDLHMHTRNLKNDLLAAGSYQCNCLGEAQNIRSLQGTRIHDQQCRVKSTMQGPIILPLTLNVINENTSVANPDPHSQNSFFSQISIRRASAYGILDVGFLLFNQR